jgi:hypothetical protein
VSPANHKTTLFGVSHRVYATSLIFYPKDLRGDFGDQMSEAFDEQAWEAYSRKGFPGLLRVWFGALREIVTVAFPRRLAERMVPIVAVAATSALMLWFASYISYVMETACSGCSIN